MVDWKSRYAELVEQLDRQRERQNKKQSLLAAGLKSSSQLARGLDPRADQKLLAMLALLRQQDIKNVDLEVAVAALEKQSILSLAERNKNLKRILSAIKKLSSQTRSLPIGRETHQLLKQIESKLHGAGFEKIPTHLESLTALHKTALKQSKQRSGHSVWRQWLSPAKAPEDTPANFDFEDPTDSDSSNLESSDLMDLASDAAAATDGPEQQAREKGRPVSGDTKTKSTDLGSVIKREFTTLLQQLGHPKQTRDLQAKLNTTFSVSDISGLTAAVCDASVEAIGNDRIKLRSSIHQLSSRINVSVNQIDSCRTIHENNLAADQALTAAIAQSYSTLESSLTTADNLEALREDLKGSLETIKAALAAHLEQTDLQSLTGALESVARQMTHIQDMGRATLFRMDTQIKEAITDSVTGVPNRVAFRQTVPNTLKLIKQSEASASIAVGMIDDFQQLKQQGSKEQLDASLKALTQHCQSMIDRKIQLFRLGENEFALLYPDCRSHTAASNLDTLRQSIAQLPLTSGKLTMSFGIVDCKDSDSAESALARAKRACDARTAKNSISLPTSTVAP